MANGPQPVPGARAPQPSPDRPAGPVRAYRPSAPKSRLTTRLKRIVFGFVLPAVILGALFIPYPYETGGAFQFLPSHRVEVRSELEGLVEEVLVREGQWVEAGAPLARLVKRVHEKNHKAAVAQMEERRAQLDLLRRGAKPEEVERAESAVQTARTSLSWSKPRADRFTQLYRDKMVSQQEYESALMQRDIDSAELEEALADLKLVKSGSRPEQIAAMEAEIASLQALVDNYRIDLDRTELTSPIAGRVVTPRVEELQGAYLKPGQRDLIIQVEDARTLQAEVEVPEEDVGDVRIGARVKVVTWAYHDTTFMGEVVRVAPAATHAAGGGNAMVYGQAAGPTEVKVADPESRVVRVTTEIPNPDGQLKSEMTGYAKIATGSRPVWDVLFRPLIRWVMVEVWYWIP